MRGVRCDFIGVLAATIAALRSHCRAAAEGRFVLRVHRPAAAASRPERCKTSQHSLPDIRHHPTLNATQLLTSSTSQTASRPSMSLGDSAADLQPDKTKVIRISRPTTRSTRTTSRRMQISAASRSAESSTTSRWWSRPVPRRGIHDHRPRHQGQAADFAAGREYGSSTLDSIRAAFDSPTVDLPTIAKGRDARYPGGDRHRVGRRLAPLRSEVNKRMIGAAIGGILVHRRTTALRRGPA